MDPIETSAAAGRRAALPDLRAQSALEPKLRRGIALAALASALAPFVLQTAVLAWSGSLTLTLLAAGTLALMFVIAALALQAQFAGAWRALSAGSVLGTVLAVTTYHALAFPVAYVINALWLGVR